MLITKFYSSIRPAHIGKISDIKTAEATATKWNFLKFEPGPAEGHCGDLDKHKPYDAVAVVVKHKNFMEDFDLNRFKELMENGDHPVLIDVKGMYDREKAISQGFAYWRL